MRILMVNKFLYPAGGAETYVFQLGAYWEAKGHKVEYFGMDHPENAVRNRWGLYTAAVDFHKSGIRSNMVNPLKLVYSIEAKRKMGELLKEFQPDVVHINNFNYQLTPSILLAMEQYRKRYGRKMRIVYTAHDPQLVCPSHYMYRPGSHQACDQCLTGGFVRCIAGRCIHGSLIRSCLGTAEALYWNWRKVYGSIDTIVCPSSFMKEKLDTNPLLAGKTVMLRNFVGDIERREAQKGKYVLYFGRYSEEKGIRTLLEVCRELPHIPFAFAGSGPLNDLISGIANVRNVGFLSGEALDKVIREARFSICPSECNENCPFSVIESMMHGTPVLGSDRGGIPELIEDGCTGWIFKAGDKDALKEKIQLIWESEEPELFQHACREKQFDSPEEYGNKMLRIYRGE